MDLQLTGKRALIAGGSKGIGLAIARGLAAEGADIAIAARGAEVEQVAADLASEFGVLAIGVRADTADDASVRAAVERVVAELGGVDILVNTAAKAWTPDMNVPASQTSDELMREQFEGKPLGYLRTARAVIPYMVAAGWGRIINVSGLGARAVSSPAQTVRNVAVSAITKNLADELGPKGINVTVLHPGTTRTEAMIARGDEPAPHNSIHRLLDASDVADVAVFLASPRSIAITGDAVAAGGGVPGPIYY